MRKLAQELGVERIPVTLVLPDLHRTVLHSGLSEAIDQHGPGVEQVEALTLDILLRTRAGLGGHDRPAI